jgi:choline dehydrogenase-like flavoprotein
LTTRPDVCVVGSGPAGAFAAVRLAEAGLSVLVVEAGTDQPDSDFTATVERLNILGGAKPNYGFARQVGGSSNLWAGRVAPMEAIDFAHRSWVGESGWPFGASELRRYYSEALDILGLPAEPPGIEESVPHEWQELSRLVDLKQFYWSTPPFNTGAYLRSNIAALSPRLILKDNTKVLSLDCRADGSGIRSITVCSGDTVETVEADHFIVAAGGIETPRLLLNSTSHFATGIGNQNDNVGRYLSTHPKADIGLLLLNRGTSIAYSAFTDRSRGDVKARTGVGLDASAQERLETLNHYVQLTPLFEFQANRAFEILKGSASVNSPLINRSAAVRGILPGLGSMLYEGIGRLGGMQRRAKRFILRGFLDQFPSRNHRVSLTNTRDEHGLRKVDIEWTFTEPDRRSVLSMLGELDRVFTASGLGTVDYSVLHQRDEWPITGIHSHFMGTTRMGDDPSTSVVDRDGLIHGMDNLFVSGPSTFPTYGYANPFLTISALSLRTADQILDRVKNRSPRNEIAAGPR